jgi:hypothetical protein
MALVWRWMPGRGRPKRGWRSGLWRRTQPYVSLCRASVDCRLPQACSGMFRHVQALTGIVSLTHAFPAFAASTCSDAWTATWADGARTEVCMHAWHVWMVQEMHRQRHTGSLAVQHLAMSSGSLSSSQQVSPGVVWGHLSMAASSGVAQTLPQAQVGLSSGQQGSFGGGSSQQVSPRMSGHPSCALTSLVTQLLPQAQAGNSSEQQGSGGGTGSSQQSPSQPFAGLQSLGDSGSALQWPHAHVGLSAGQHLSGGGGIGSSQQSPSQPGAESHRFGPSGSLVHWPHAQYGSASVQHSAGGGGGGGSAQQSPSQSSGGRQRSTSVASLVHVPHAQYGSSLMQHWAGGGVGGGSQQPMGSPGAGLQAHSQPVALATSGPPNQ